MHRNSARRARAAFAVTTLLVSVATMVVATQWLHPVLSFIVGLLTGLVSGATAWCVVRVWPIARLIWWWLPELATVSTIVYGWVQLNRLPLPAVATVMAMILTGLLTGPVRRRVTAWVWCLIVRHRLRTCFAQFIVANQSGSLPLILAARPTSVGERVWIYLRPGLSPTDLESRLEKIAVACHASAVLVQRASSRTAGLIRVDIKRREVLGGLVGSPLAGGIGDLVDSIPVSPAPAGMTIPPRSPAAMDLPDITIMTPVAPAPAVKPRPAPAPVPKPPAALTGEDLSDWLD